MKSPFSTFPQKPPARILLYGDPGTEKTRRALGQMPGPVAMIDTEAGSGYYADIAPAGSGYLLTRSLADIKAAIAYLRSKDGGAFKTVIVDPITEVWHQAQAVAIEALWRRQCALAKRKNQEAPSREDVKLDVDGWGRAKAIHAGIISELMTLPQHVVLIARGADSVNERGEVTGYKPGCEKGLPFLMSTVVCARRDGDHVEKDRSGALTEGRHKGRVSLSAVCGASGSTAPAIVSEEAAAASDAERMEQPTSVDPRLIVRAADKLKSMGLLDYACEEFGHPSGWTRESIKEIAAIIKAQGGAMEAK